VASTSRTVQLDPSLARIRQWLDSVVDDPQARRKLLTLATMELTDRARVYPNAGLWNFEPGAQDNGVWYQRLWGSRWRSKKTGRLAGRNTSQRLQRSWKVQLAPDSFSADVFTNVTYAPYLLDPNQRVGWAEAHGWQTVDELAEGYAPRFVELVEEFIDDQIARPI